MQRREAKEHRGVEECDMAWRIVNRARRAVHRRILLDKAVHDNFYEGMERRGKWRRRGWIH